MGRDFNTYKREKSGPSYKRLALYVSAFVLLAGSAFGAVLFGGIGGPPPLPALTAGGQAAILYHPGLGNTTQTIPLITVTFDNATGEMAKGQSSVNLWTFIHDNPVRNTNDLLQPDAVQAVGYGIVFLVLDDGQFLYVGCNNYGQPNEICFRAVLSNQQLDFAHIKSL